MAKSSDGQAWAMPTGSTAPKTSGAVAKAPRATPNSGTASWNTSPAPTVSAKAPKTPQQITAAPATKAMKKTAPWSAPKPLAVRAPRAKTKGQM